MNSGENSASPILFSFSLWELFDSGFRPKVSLKNFPHRALIIVIDFVNQREHNARKFVGGGGGAEGISILYG